LNLCEKAGAEAKRAAALVTGGHMENL
jgi:hypothetical protein